MSDELVRKRRWRLVLGGGADDVLGALPEGEWQERDVALSYLYDREYGPARNVRRGAGSLAPSRLTVPEWVNAVHELFPRKTIERIEKDALERYQVEELVTNADLLGRAQPSQTLVKAVLRTKHLLVALGMAAAPGAFVDRLRRLEALPRRSHRADGPRSPGGRRPTDAPALGGGRSGRG